MRQIRFHDLRHLCATMLLASGSSLVQIQSWLGHSDITTTRKYLHISLHDKKIAVKNIEQAMSDLAKYQLVAS